MGSKKRNMIPKNETKTYKKQEPEFFGVSFLVIFSFLIFLAVPSGLNVAVLSPLGEPQFPEETWPRNRYHMVPCSIPWFKTVLAVV